jgi:hypothetical protein
MGIGGYDFKDGCREIRDGLLGVAKAMDRFTDMQREKAIVGKDAVDRLSTAIENAVTEIQKEAG